MSAELFKNIEGQIRSEKISKEEETRQQEIDNLAEFKKAEGLGFFDDNAKKSL